MINLLPIENKKIIKKEYLKRLAIIAGIFLLFINIVAIIFLGTLFFLLNNQKKIYEKQFSFMQKHLPTADEEKISFFVSEMNKKISDFEEAKKNEKEISPIIKKILIMKKEEIQINAISFSRETDDGFDKITMRGISQTRKALIGFVEELKKEPTFKEVSSPFSSFLKSENIEFNISIKVHE